MAEDKKINCAYARSRSIKVSVQKAKIILQAIQGAPVEKALKILKFSRRRVSPEIYKILKSAIANAENNYALNPGKLYVSQAIVGRGLVLKRFHARARGRGAPILKPTSQILIQVKEGII